MNAPPLKLATWNVRGLQDAGYSPWSGFAPYDHHEYAGKLDFLATRLRKHAADIVGIQEIGRPKGFSDLHERVRDLYPHAVLGEEGGNSKLRNGILSRHPVVQSFHHRWIPERGRIRMEAGTPVVRETFRRPLVAVRVDWQGSPLTFLCVHLKSQAPDLIEHEARSNDPVVVARGLARSLILRAAEAVGVRTLAIQHRAETQGGAVAVGGDFNDDLEAITTQLVGDAPNPRFVPNGGFDDRGLYNTLSLMRRRGELPFHTHLWDRQPGVLDFLCVTAELAKRLAALEVENDFLETAPTDRSASDHGLVVASFAPA